MALYKSIGSAPADIKSCFNNFKNDLIDEMHDTEDAVIKYMEENEENYKYGRKGGGNLRYSNMLWINCFQNNFDWIFSTLYSILKKDADQVFQAKNIEKYLYHLYLDRLEPSAGETISVTFDYSLLDWAEKEKITPLSDFAGDTTYEFLKTEISDIDKLSIWQDFGFKLDKKKSPKPAGYQNKLFISRLRRSIKCLDNKYGTKNKNYSKQENKVGKLAL
jgi:hypothetical protein